MTTPQFADPAPPEAKRKKWIVNGRYALPDPDNGKARTWTRVTNMDVLSDKYAIQEWEKRKIAKGLALRPDLVAMASALDPDNDRDAMNKLAREAKEAAGGSAGANLGTALHKLTERVDAGEDVDAGMFAGELAAYRSALATEGLSVDPAYLERIVCVPELGCAGRLDKLLRVRNLKAVTHQVGDLKSQKSMDFGGLSMGIQLAIYSRAYAVWNEETETWEDPPAMDQEMATVIWLPVGRNMCEMYDVDLCLGWEFARMSFDVRGRVRKAPVVRKRAPALFLPNGMNADPLPVSNVRAPETTLANLLGTPEKGPLATLADDMVAAYRERGKALMDPAEAASTVPVSETISESGINATNFPANAASQSQMVARSNVRTTVGGPSGTWGGPDLQVPGDASPRWTMYRDVGAWERVFRDATTVEELTQAGVAALGDFGGQLPDSLKALGRKLRAELEKSNATAPAA